METHKENDKETVKRCVSIEQNDNSQGKEVILSQLSQSIVSSSFLAGNLSESLNSNDPSTAEQFIKLAKDEEIKHHSTGALHLYNKALKISPNEFQIHELKALCLCSLNRFDDAITLIDDKIKSGFMVVNMTCLKAKCYLKFKRPKEALEIINDLLKSSQDLGVLVIKANCLYDLKRRTDSMEISDEVLDKDPNNAKALFQKAKILTDEKKFMLAIDLFNKAIDNKYDNLNEVYFYKGYCYQQLNNYPQAVESYSFISQYESNCKLYYNMAVCYEEMKLYRKAADNYDLCLVVSPKNIDILEKKANCLMKVQDYSKAFSCFVKLAKYGNKKLNAYVNIAEIYLKKKNIQEASDTLSKAERVLRRENNNEEINTYYPRIVEMRREIEREQCAIKPCQCSECLIF